MSPIKENNEAINSSIESIVEFMKENKISTFDEKGNLIDEVKELLEMEMRKTALLYKSIFPGFECKKIFPDPEKENEDVLTVSVKDEPKFECRGSENGIKVYTGIQDFINRYLKNDDYIKYVRDEKTGKVFATSVEEIEALKIENKQTLKPLVDKDGNLIEGTLKTESSRDQIDYMAEIIAEGKIDLDFMLDVLAHEAMHIFIPGEGVFVEGTTERLTREAADEFGLRLSPTSHQRETEIISSLEKIVGRDVLASISLNNDQKNRRPHKSDPGYEENKKEFEEERFETLKNAIDEKMGPGTFSRLKDVFDKEYDEFINNKMDFEKYRNGGYYKGILNELNDWIEKNPEKCVPSKEFKISESDKTKIINFQYEEVRCLKKLREKLQERCVKKEQSNENKLEETNNIKEANEDSDAR